MNLVQNAATMTSKEIADLAGKRHDNTMDVCRDLLAKNVTPEIQESTFIHTNGVAYPCYILNKRDSYILMARLSPEFTGKLVDRWQELEAQQAKPLSPMEMVIASAQMIIKLEAEQAHQAKVLAVQQQYQQAMQSQVATIVDTVAELEDRVNSAMNKEIPPAPGFASIKTLEGYIAGRFPKSLLRPLIQEQIASIQFMNCRKWIDGTAEYTDYHAFNIMDVMLVLDKVIKSGVRVMKSNNTPSTKVLSPLFSQAFKHPM